MLKINKIILIFIIILFSAFLVNASDYGANYNYGTIGENEKYEETYYSTPEINFGEIKVRYNIGFKNDIGENSLFYPIELNFYKNKNSLSTEGFNPLISGTLEIYKEKFEYKNGGKIGQGEEFYKKIEFKNTNNLKTYFYKNNNYGSEKYYFYLKINGKRKKLKVNTDQFHYFNNLLFINYGKIRNYFSISKIPELFILKQFDKIYFKKDKISKKELEILKNYIFSGGKLILKEKLFKKYFGENKEIIKTAYPKNCVDYKDCDENGKEIFIEKNKYFYKYGFGKIYLEDRNRLENYRGYNEGIDELFFKEYEIKKILIDDVIKSKFVPFDVILYFTIIYFLSFLFLNFVLAKKYKNNKFFLFYSIPAGALFFLIIIISISFYYKGFKDIENKVQVNLHKNNKILSQVFIANFSPNGGDYKLKIDKQNYSDNFINRNYHYRENFSKKEISYENGKINRKLLGVNSSSIQYFNYYKIVDENSLSTEGFSPLKKFKSKNELLSYFNNEKNIEFKTDFLGDIVAPVNFYEENKNYNKKIEKNYNIKEIIVSKKETKFMKKYSFGGEKNSNLVIDVFYK